MFLLTTLQASGVPVQPQPSLFDTLIMFLPILVIIYFFMIRPQQKKMKAHREMVGGVRRGDQVVTSGGLIGKIAKVSDDEVLVDLGNDIRVRVVKHTISDVRSKTEPAKVEKEK